MIFTTFTRYLRYEHYNLLQLKPIYLFMLLALCQSKCLGQNLFLKIKGGSNIETQKIDSLSYKSLHKSTMSIEKEIHLLSDKLNKAGYLEHTYESIIKNDTIHFVTFHLKKKTKTIHIYISKNDKVVLNNITPFENDSLIIPYTEASNFIINTLKKLESQGYPQATVKFIDYKKKGNQLHSTLEIKRNQKRRITAIVIRDENKSVLPKNYYSFLKKKYLNQTLNEEKLTEIKNEIDNFTFVKQNRHPEILLSKDSTQVYLYLEKRKANYFDGFIGLGYDDKRKPILNGYLDLRLQNLLKKGEDFYLYWKNDGNDQKTFRTGIRLNYILKTSLGLKAQLYIFKQDSTFQNSKTLLDLNYLTHYSTSFFLGIESITSSAIQKNDNHLSDFKSQFTTIGLNYTKEDKNDSFFPEKRKIEIRLGTGKRNSEVDNLNNNREKQHYIQLNLHEKLNINSKNNLTIRSYNYYLKSNNYLTNELYRFGGIQSIRGVLENSLQCNWTTIALTEYNYTINKSVYVHTIFDYCVYQDPTQTKNKKINKINSIGLGLGIATKNGIIKFSITNNSNSYSNLRLFNSITNISYNVKF